MGTDLSIFTNYDNIKTSDRLKTFFKHAENFDCLVGYFRITGFYLLQNDLKDVSEIRFLIGLGTDSETSLSTKLSLFDQNAYKITPLIKEQVRNEFNNSKDNLEVENGVNEFINWIKSGKVKIRVCADKNVHAKVYIVRNKKEISDLQYGNVITGSSNFSYNGLEKNIEFNVELKDRKNVEHASDFFNKLWETSIEVTNEIEEIIKKETWMNVSITPYQLFLKTLYTYFEEEIGDNNLDIDLPPNFMKLKYQEDAVFQAKKILEKHGGVLISDVVGLGKTYIAVMLGVYLGRKKRKLFIVPPIVKEYWETIIEEFNYSQRDKVVSLGTIDKVSQWHDLSAYDYVFIDEAHRFRNVESKEFQYLKQICYGKGVILITATPQNNYITDIVNLISLFQDLKESSIIPGVPDMDGFFRYLKSEVNKKRGSEEHQQVLNDAMSEIRDKVLKNIMVRRTRTEVMKYYKYDLDKQGLKFPILNTPERIPYIYNEVMDKAFDSTITLLAKLKYARYTPLLYVTQKDLLGERKSGQENIRGFIKALLIKRLESSIYAFSESLKRIKNSHSDYLKMFYEDKLVIGNLSKSNNYELDYILSLSETDFLDLVEKRDLVRIDKSLLNDTYEIDLQNDYLILEQLHEMWSSFDIQNDDAKYDHLINCLNKVRSNKKNKVIIFSEAKDTVEYLEKKLSKMYDGEVISFSGSDSASKKDYIKQNFDPKDKNPLNDKFILITTDSMSEGINLHVSNILINYDLPWNPTRVMQRVGRINRVGSNHDELFVYNFFPAVNTREHLSLEDSIKIKIQMFHTLLGEDSKYLTDEEVVTTQAFFDILMMKDFNLSDEDEEFNLNSSKMEYLQIINNVRINNPVLFSEIANLPNKLRIARMSTETKLVSFIKRGIIKEFFYTDGVSCNELEFDKAMELLKANITDEKVNIPDKYYEYLAINTEEFRTKVNNYFNNGYKAKGTPKNLREVGKYVNFLSNQNLTYENKELMRQVSDMLEKGSLSNYIYKEILNGIKKIENKNDVNSIAKVFENKIPNVYFSERKKYEVKDVTTETEVIILSEYFIKGNE